MKLVDETPFETLTFEHETPKGDRLQVVVVRGTFLLNPNASLVAHPKQELVVMADTYYGEPGKSSVQFPNDLAPFKPNTDIIINGTARAPGGKPSAGWNVSCEVGKLKKSVIVTGPRFWKHRVLVGWQLGDVTPCVEVPLRYEYSFGGQWQHKNDGAVWEANPIGRGYVKARYAPNDQPIPAPQILNAKGECPSLGGPGVTEGFGALAPAWIQRRRHAGTFDESWKKARAPRMPEDFKYDFYNVAHPDLTIDGYLSGGETVTIDGMDAHGKVHVELPKFRFGAVLTDKAGFSYGAYSALDTVHFDLDEKKAFLVWRTALPLFEDGVAVLKIKMDQSNTAN